MAQSEIKFRKKLRLIFFLIFRMLTVTPAENWSRQIFRKNLVFFSFLADPIMGPRLGFSGILKSWRRKIDENDFFGITLFWCFWTKLDSKWGYSGIIESQCTEIFLFFAWSCCSINAWNWAKGFFRKTFDLEFLGE